MNSEFQKRIRRFLAGKLPAAHHDYRLPNGRTLQEDSKLQGKCIHKAIWQFYAEHCNSDGIEPHDSSIKKVVNDLRPRPLGHRINWNYDADCKIDISDGKRKIIFEIKSATDWRAGRKSRNYYIEQLELAGFRYEPGPVSMPGTEGVLIFPGHYVVFLCIEPGLILYQLYDTDWNLLQLPMKIDR